MMKLSSLRGGQTACVECIEGDACMVRRLRALGVKPGRALSVLRCAAFNGPMHVRVGGTEFFLRKRDAGLISVSAQAQV